VSLRRPPSEAVPVESKQNLTDGDARWKIPECWRDESHESHRKKCQLNSTACPTRSNASVSEGWEQRGSKCPIRLPHAQVDSDSWQHREPYTLLVYPHNPGAEKWLKRAMPGPILKFKLNIQPYVEVICGRQKPVRGSVWAAGLHEESGELTELIFRRYWPP